MKTFVKVSIAAVISLFMMSCEIQEVGILGEVQTSINKQSFETLSTTGELVRTRRDGGSKNLTFNAFFKDGGETLAVSVTNYLEGGAGRDFPANTYTHDSEDLNAVVLFFDGSVRYDKTISSEVIITQNDTDNRMVNGTFSALITNEAGDSLRVENGTFENISY